MSENAELASYAVLLVIITGVIFWTLFGLFKGVFLLAAHAFTGAAASLAQPTAGAAGGQFGGYGIAIIFVILLGISAYMDTA